LAIGYWLSAIGYRLFDELQAVALRRLTVQASALGEMKQNIYDMQEFFEGYMNLRKGEQGLNGVLEQPTLRSLLPNLQACGFSI
jgi:hypothetical protein